MDDPEFVINPDTDEIHHIPFIQGQCNVENYNNWPQFDTLKAAREAGGDLCGHCFKSKE